MSEEQERIEWILKQLKKRGANRIVLIKSLRSMIGLANGSLPSLKDSKDAIDYLYPEMRPIDIKIHDELISMRNHDSDRLTMIKHLKNKMRWDLKIAKEWLDKHIPSIPIPTLNVSRDIKEELNKILRYEKNHPKIKMIKYLRNKTQWGLKESKEWIEANYVW